VTAWNLKHGITSAKEEDWARGMEVENAADKARERREGMGGGKGGREEGRESGRERGGTPPTRRARPPYSHGRVVKGMISMLPPPPLPRRRRRRRKSRALRGNFMTQSSGYGLPAISPPRSCFLLPCLRCNSTEKSI
jgi:hypothetical protein